MPLRSWNDVLPGRLPRCGHFLTRLARLFDPVDNSPKPVDNIVDNMWRTRNSPRARARHSLRSLTILDIYKLVGRGKTPPCLRPAA